MVEFSEKEKQRLWEKYEEMKRRDLHLDMSRGKPGADQLDLSEGLLSAVETGKDCIGENGVDYRNYGLLTGIPELKCIFAEMLQIRPTQIILGGNSSLTMMYDTLVDAMLYGVAGGEPWSKQKNLSFLCVVPGYDRHFAITEKLGIRMITVPLLETGPDMDLVEKLVAEDPSVKGMWCVPKYSNPDGITYSDETVRRLARMKTAAQDFRIFWDNAYAFHDLGDNRDELLNIFAEAETYGTQDRIYMFCSTSKITFPGSGVAMMACSEENVHAMEKNLFYETIGPDKINQMRHVAYFRNATNMREYMRKHAAILKPRFDAVLSALERELTGICSWHVPRGGYFISLNVPDGCARRTVRLLAELGVKMTPAGATFPYHDDPRDRNIRIAPSYPSLEDIRLASEAICLCAKLAVAEKQNDLPAGGAGDERRSLS